MLKPEPVPTPKAIKLPDGPEWKPEDVERVARRIIEAAEKDNQGRMALWAAFYEAKKSNIPYEVLAAELARKRQVSYSKAEISMGATIYEVFIEQEARDPEDLEGIGVANLYLTAAHLRRNPEELADVEGWLERARSMTHQELKGVIRKTNPKATPTALRLTEGIVANIEAFGIRLQEMKLVEGPLPLMDVVDEVFNRLLAMNDRQVADFWEVSRNILEEIASVQIRMGKRVVETKQPVIN